MNIEMYTSQNCSFCVNAKTLLKQNELVYTEIDVSNDTDKATKMVERSGLITVPQIYIDGELIGGFTELARSYREGNLVEK